MNNDYLNFSREELLEQYINQRNEILLLKAELAQIKRLIYGSKSERFVAASNPNQIALELETEEVVAPPPTLQTVIYDRVQKQSSVSVHAGRNPLPAHLPRVEIIIDPDGDVSGLKQIGSEITEQLEYEPGKFFVKKYIRRKYVSPEGLIQIGTLPSFPIEKGIPGSSLLASIIIDKYADHLPLYRQMERFKRNGVTLSSSTIGEWVSASCTMVVPLCELLKLIVLSSDYLQVDETPIKVLDRDKKGKTHRGYYWVYRDVVSGLVLFDYREGRGRDGPTELLKNFKGYLQTDGYNAYEIFDKGEIKLIHCMAHARRNFEKALDNDRIRAEYILSEMQKLYDVERTAREQSFSHDQRYALRMEKSVPVLKELHQWLKNNIIEVTPKSSIGQAIAYALPRWTKLMMYTTDGKLEIDNNLVENSIRPIAIGRKNYLFAGSHAGAQRAAMIYSLLGTCKLKGIEPYQWLKNIFDVLPEHKANKLHELLP